tara:strand:+ start:305 stop:574 length:270 start_codon:yes stop_codon:yes gene_type:complete
MENLHEKDDSCIICFHQLKKKTKKFICYTCNKQYHYKCLTSWHKKSGYSEKVCPHCLTDDLLFIYHDKWYYDYLSCCGYSKFTPVLQMK